MKLNNILKYIFLFIVVFLVSSLFYTGSIVANVREDSFADMERLELVEYQLKMVRIEEEDMARLGLRELSLELGLEEAFSFLTAGSLVEMAGITGGALFQLEAYYASGQSSEISRPTLISLLGEPVNMSLTEEILQIDPDFPGGSVRDDQGLELNLLPERKDQVDNLLTRMRVSSGDVSTVETNFWSEKQEIKLVGLVNWNRRTVTGQHLSRGERTKTSTFALYITHDLVDINEERRQNTITIDGLNRLLWPELEEREDSSGYFQVISRPDLEILIVDYEQGAGFNLVTAGGIETVTFGADTVVSVVYQDLRVGLRGIWNRIPDNKEMEIAPVLGERVFLDPYLELSGYYYPVFFNLQQGKVEAVHAFEVEMAVKYNPLSARLRYSSDLGANELRLLFGLNVNENITLILGAEGDSNEVEEYLAGFRLNF